jgi:hypothetical protein
MYCLDCMNSALCSQCLAYHRDHHAIQVSLGLEQPAPGPFFERRNDSSDAPASIQKTLLLVVLSVLLVASKVATSNLSSLHALLVASKNRVA